MRSSAASPTTVVDKLKPATLEHRYIARVRYRNQTVDVPIKRAITALPLDELRRLYGSRCYTCVKMEIEKSKCGSETPCKRCSRLERLCVRARPAAEYFRKSSSGNLPTCIICNMEQGEDGLSIEDHLLKHNVKFQAHSPRGSFMSIGQSRFGDLEENHLLQKYFHKHRNTSSLLPANSCGASKPPSALCKLCFSLVRFPYLHLKRDHKISLAGWKKVNGKNPIWQKMRAENFVEKSLKLEEKASGGGILNQRRPDLTSHRPLVPFKAPAGGISGLSDILKSTYTLTSDPIGEQSKVWCLVCGEYLHTHKRGKVEMLKLMASHLQKIHGYHVETREIASKSLHTSTPLDLHFKIRINGFEAAQHESHSLRKWIRCNAELDIVRDDESIVRRAAEIIEFNMWPSEGMIETAASPRPDHTIKSMLQKAYPRFLIMVNDFRALYSDSAREKSLQGWIWFAQKFDCVVFWSPIFFDPTNRWGISSMFGGNMAVLMESQSWDVMKPNHLDLYLSKISSLMLVPRSRLDHVTWIAASKVMLPA